MCRIRWGLSESQYSTRMNYVVVSFSCAFRLWQRGTSCWVQSLWPDFVSKIDQFNCGWVKVMKNQRVTWAIILTATEDPSQCQPLRTILCGFKRISHWKLHRKKHLNCPSCTSSITLIPPILTHLTAKEEEAKEEAGVEEEDTKIHSGDVIPVCLRWWGGDISLKVALSRENTHLLLCFLSLC